MFVPSGFPVGVVVWLWGAQCGGMAGPRTVRYQIIKTFGLVWNSLLGMFEITFSARVQRRTLYILGGMDLVSVVVVTCSAEVP